VALADGEPLVGPVEEPVGRGTLEASAVAEVAFAGDRLPSKAKGGSDQAMKIAGSVGSFLGSSL